MADVLAETAFSLQVVENYRGLPIPPGKNIAPLMQRISVYGVRNASENVLEGRQVVGFIAAGIGTPIPINTAGNFRMIRLASAPAAKGKAPAAKGGDKAKAKPKGS